MPSYPYSYVYYTSPLYSVVLPVLATIVALAGGLALYFLFVRRPNRYHGAAARLHDALTFRTFYTERLLRALYCITVVALTVYSFILLFSHFFLALLCFAGGNLIARIVYEYALLLLVLCRNAQEINRKMGPLPEEPAAPSAPPQGNVPPRQPEAPQQPPRPAQAPVPPAAPQQPPVPPQQPQPGSVPPHEPPQQ